MTSVSLSHPGIRMRLYSDGQDRPSVLYWLIGEEEISFADQLPAGAALITVPAEDWNRDLSPWPAPAVFRGQPFSGGADSFLRRLQNEWMPAALRETGLRPSRQGILGYSLAGLFSLYAMIQTDLFDLAASVSGSLWFDGWTDWFAAHRPGRVPERLYFSIGDREKNARNPRLAKGEACTSETALLARAYCPQVLMELNPGGHFEAPGQRLCRAIDWLSQPLPEPAQ